MPSISSNHFSSRSRPELTQIPQIMNFQDTVLVTVWCNWCWWLKLVTKVIDILNLSPISLSNFYFWFDTKYVCGNVNNLWHHKIKIINLDHFASFRTVTNRFLHKSPPREPRTRTNMVRIGRIFRPGFYLSVDIWYKTIFNVRNIFVSSNITVRISSLLSFSKMIENYSNSEIVLKLLGSNMISSETQGKIIKHTLFSTKPQFWSSQSKNPSSTVVPLRINYKLQPV